MTIFRGKGVTRDIQKKSRRKILVKLVDSIILTMLEKNSPLSGYDLMDSFVDRFGTGMSSGTIYAHLYKLERQGLVEATPTERKVLFSLTGRGKQTRRSLIASIEEVLEFLKPQKE